MNADHRWPLIALFILVALVLIGPLMAGTMMGPGYMMGPGMRWGGPGTSPPVTMPGWAWGLGMAFGWLAMLAFWGALILGVVLLVRWLSSAAGHAGPSSQASSLEILKRRYAQGEIDQATYERMRREIE